MGDDLKRLVSELFLGLGEEYGHVVRPLFVRNCGFVGCLGSLFHGSEIAIGSEPR